MAFDVNRQLDPRTGAWATTIDIPREGTAPLLAKVLGITSLGFLITAAGVATRAGLGDSAPASSPCSPWSSRSPSRAKPVPPSRSACS